MARRRAQAAVGPAARGAARGGQGAGDGAAQKLIGSGLEARVRILSAPEDLPELLARKRELLATLFIVSRVDLVANGGRASVVYESQDIPGLVIGVDRAPGEKCERCWTRTEEVGRDAHHPTLCARCVRVVSTAR